MRGSGRQKKTYLVIGLGRFGSALCDGLVSQGASVIAVDSDMAKVQAFSEKVEFVARLDATNEASLEKAGAKDADVAIVCLGDNNQASIMTSAILLDLGVPRLIACASDAVQARILKKIGVHQVIMPQDAMGRRTADLLMRPWMGHFADLGDDTHIAGSVKTPAKIVGRPLKELDLPSKYGLSIISVLRAGRRILPGADLSLEPGDELMIFGEKSRLSKLFDREELEEASEMEL